MKVFGRMPVLRIVTAADMAAGPAEAQMHPLIATLEAFLAPIGVGATGFYECEMRATQCVTP
jgi:hypothetical protein